MHTHPVLEATGSDDGKALKGFTPGRGMVKVAYEKVSAGGDPRRRGLFSLDLGQP